MNAERAGDEVRLRWTTPSRTTDDLEIRGTTTAQICRQAGEKACLPVKTLQVTPGASQTAEVLPAALLTGAPVLLAYRIQILNGSGRSAGNSVAAAWAASGAAPEPVADFRISGRQGGSVLEWQPGSDSDNDLVELRRSNLAMHPEAAKKSSISPGQLPGRSKTTKEPRPSEASQGVVFLRTRDRTVGQGSGRSSGTVDETAVMGEDYSYAAYRVRTVTVGGHSLEIRSSSSPAVTIALRDTFPPKSPAGLETVANSQQAAASKTESLSIDLSWEPNTEADLAGYVVYRQLAGPDGSPQGPVERLTPLPIAAPAYRDVAVKAGQGYIYHVTAVDASGNESAPSAKAREMIESPQ